ncbi:MAG TPA: purine-nucleoside phosphorylase [Acidimicrobiales bacterium]
MTPLPSDPFARAAADADALRTRTGVDRFEAVIVLGSGLGGFAAELDDAQPVAMADLAGFPTPGVTGHDGTIVTGRLHGYAVMVLAGRVHLYEGRTVHEVCHGVRVAAAAGVGTAVLTNAAGGIRPDLEVGALVAISDHLNLSGANPLTGPLTEPRSGGSSFVDLSAAYDPALRRAAATVSPGMTEGVYAALAGPTYETPAEIRMLATLGADLVGMSTANEAIACRHLGVRVAGVSLVTNRAAGLGEPLSHAEVTAVGRAAATDVVAFLRAFVPLACRGESE